MVAVKSEGVRDRGGGGGEWMGQQRGRLTLQTYLVGFCRLGSKGIFALVCGGSARPRLVDGT